MSGDIFERFLEALDGNKQFFTAADIARFEPYRHRMADAVRSGDPAPAFAMFSVYRQRVDERVAQARKLLGQGQQFDFSGQERWNYDREEAPWAADAAALDAIWRKSVMNDWLRLKLAGKEPAEIRKTLDRRYVQIGRSVEQLKSEDVFSLFLNAYTASIDPHTNYLNPRTAENFNQAMSLSLEGIGAQLQRQDDVVVIREIIPGGPAAMDGTLKAGDRIVGVGQGRSGAVEDVQTAQSNLRRYRQQAAALEDAARAYDRAYQLARQSYSEGALAPLDLLDADRSTLTAGISAASARNEAAKEWAALQIAAGAGAGEIVLVSR